MTTRNTILTHSLLIVVSIFMLTPIYWVIKTSITGDNMFVYPPSIIPRDPNLFYYVEA